MKVEIGPDGYLYFTIEDKNTKWKIEGEFPNQAYYCPICGKQSRDAEYGAKFCPWCGEKVD